jgi:hypothetical protein
MSSPSSIFLSYRRTDTQDVAGRIFDELSSRFGRRKVFKDVDSIPIASDFRDFILDQIRYSVVLVLIGPAWLAQEALDERGRLWNEDDFVRLEIEAALKFRTPLVPVFINNAHMPARDLLPPSIRALCRKQGLEVRADPHFHSDVRRLAGMLGELLRDEAERRAAPPELLDGLFDNCQAWYNDIVKTLAQIVAVLRDRRLDGAEREAAVDGIQLVYQNSRTYVPRVLSARKILGRYEGVDRIATAVDEFLSQIYVHTNDKEYAAYCRPPLEWIVREEAGARLFLDDASVEARFARDAMDMSLARISQSLQNLSDAIAEARLAR